MTDLKKADLTADMMGEGLGAPPSAAKGIWDVVTLYVRELIVAAEDELSGEGGATKKKWVEDKVMSLIEDWEKDANKIPNLIQGFVFMALRRAVGLIVERVFKALLKAGEVNVRA